MIRESNAASQAGPIQDAQSHVLVISDHRLGFATAERLDGTHDSVLYAGEYSCADSENEPAIPVISASPENIADVRRIREHVGAVDVIVVIGEDTRSLFIAHLCQLVFDPDAVLATLSDPERRPAFLEAGVQFIELPDLYATHIDSHVQEDRNT